MSFTFVYNPFTAPRLKNGHFSKKIHVPIFPFNRTCRVCQTPFETRKSRQVFCSERCKRYYLNHSSPWARKVRRRLELATQEFLEKERGDPSLVHSSFVHSQRCQGTCDVSMNLKVIMVNGQPRVYGAVWLEREIRKRN